MFKLLPDKIELSKVENQILSFWAENNTFHKSVVLREGKPSFTFYEGPPTANGMPGIHHVMARAIKDLICRYKTLRGYQVFRKAGWDTQGLPVEIEVEKQLGISSKDDIDKMGVEKFNQACRESVFKYLKEWETLTERMGYWLNLDDEYITHSNSYIESVWWALKRFFDEGFIYKGYKIQPYCPRCETPLSSHEVAQGYRDVKDPSVYVKFKIKPGQSVNLRGAAATKQSHELNFDDFYFLVWTTTPWTLISNVALSVHPDIEYAKVILKESNDKLVLAKDRLSVLKDEYEILGELKGSELEGVEYERLFDYLPVEKKAFYVTLGDFVTTADGSGIVHIAPAFGEDDYQLMKKYNLPLLQPVNKSGKFTDEVSDFKNRLVKEADDGIILKLKSEEKLYKKEKFVHSYPHCWRCHTPLLYYARESWYIKTTEYKDKMIRLNNEINWYPPETGTGRFGNWLEENRDWALSRNRYWGTPLPIWGCECKDCVSQYIAVGSIEELKSLAVNFKEVFPSDENIDLHKPMIDNIKLKCDKCGCELSRVEEVIDAWFDSGSMPFAQHHYPFENKELFERNYPADFIAEGIDQTRGWFYSLHAIGTFLFNDRAYKNLIVNDLILDKEGQKMSKHKGNIVNPFEIMDKYGADALRWYLIYSSPPWRPKMFNEDDIIEVRNKFFDTLINTYRFFALYSNLIGLNRDTMNVNIIPFAEKPEIDKWIVSEMNSLKNKYFDLMDNYDITKAARLVSDFTIEDLSNWYVRRNRKRFRNPVSEIDKLSAYQTLYQILVELFKLISPVSPFISEELFKNLTGHESVHLSYLAPAQPNEIDLDLEKEMKIAQRIVYLVRAIRVKSSLKTRQPLRQILIPASNEKEKRTIGKMKKIILEEVNVKELNFVEGNSGIIVKKAKPNYKTLGPKYEKNMNSIADAIKAFDNNTISKFEKDGGISIKVKNNNIVISKEDMDIQTENIEGWIVESSDNLTVALDIKLDDELIEEGFAREFINRVQNLRKDRKYGVNDKVKIRYKCEDPLYSAISKRKKYIENEILAVELNFEQGNNANGYEEIIVNGRTCKVSIEKI